MESIPRFALEVPLHSYSLQELAAITRRYPIRIDLYGGFPDSPLNGGRPNLVLDGLPRGPGCGTHPSEHAVAQARGMFFQAIEAANRQGIGFLVAFTNMFVEGKELNGENLAPVDWLARTGRSCGVRNGVILNSDRLREYLRWHYADDLRLVGSCTRYFTPERIATPLETIPRYLEDAGRYDLVTVTPQDSRREEVLRVLVERIPEAYSAICNAYCADACNSYYHYAAISRKNKKPIRSQAFADILDLTLDVAVGSTRCPLMTGEIEHLDVAAIAAMQISTGVTRLKLGRGRGAGKLPEVLEVIERHLSVR